MMKPVAGDFPFQMFVIVGDLNTVRDALRALYHQFADLPKGSGKGV